MAAYADILAAEGEIPVNINGEYRKICAFQLIRNLFGLRCNGYPRTRVPWEVQDHPLIIREGEFYSAVARYLMAYPGDFCEFPQGSLEGVAQRWKPGKELDIDMIKEESPTLADGVTLFNFSQRASGYGADDESERRGSIRAIRERPKQGSELYESQLDQRVEETI